MDLAATRPVTVSDRWAIRHIDPVLVGAAVALAAIGLFAIYSATHQSLEAVGLDPGRFVKRQVTFLAVGLVVLLLAASFDYRLLKIYAGMIYVSALVLLLLVRTPLGTSVKGAQRWFELFGFQLAPSEISKIALIAMLAALLSEIRGDLTLRDVFRASGLAAIPAFLVFLQPDLGTSIVFAAILVGMLVVAGARARYLGILALTAAVLIVSGFQVGLVREYQIERLRAFLDPGSVTAAALHNREQAEIAIGSGGLTGVGYLQGTQTNLDFVPEQHTDFVFTVVGEEFGFTGAIALLALYALVLWRGFRIALVSRDPFGTYLAAGIVSMFALQIFVNIGMNVGIMPITGIPLPFVSYGGSSLLLNCAAIGLLLNIHMRRFTSPALR
ncbi:MAG TPA: rod shape-determining protein RodA [Actinomycetota bacterium]|nr:rod shape-determining protein RodA [Actinomycetota bacterium]